MSLAVPPDPRDVTDFRFKKLRNVQVFDGNVEDVEKCLNLLVVSNKYGLVFVAVPNGLRVLRTSDIEALNDDESLSRVAATEFSFVTVALSSRPFHITLSCDDANISVCVIKDGCWMADMFSVQSFANMKQAVQPYASIRLSLALNVRLIDLKWNPAVANMFASCMSDGSVTVFLPVQTSVTVYGTLPSSTSATAICWSPKGKQLVVGRVDGSLTQFLPTLQEAKSIAAPTIFQSSSPVISIAWLSSFQFAVAYHVDDHPNLVIVTASKTKPPVYVNFDDICYGSSSAPCSRLYLHHQPEWGILVCSSSTSMEVALLANTSNDPLLWEQWILEDSGRAELPLCNNDETFPVGMALNLTSRKPIAINETDVIPPKPILHVLSTGWFLCTFYMINDKVNAPSLNVIPEEFYLESAMSQVSPNASFSALPSQTVFTNISFSKPTTILTSGSGGSITSGTPVAGTGVWKTPTLTSAPLNQEKSNSIRPSTTTFTLVNDGLVSPASAATPVVTSESFVSKLDESTIKAGSPVSTAKKSSKSKIAGQNALMAALTEEMNRFGTEVAAQKSSAPLQIDLSRDGDLLAMASRIDDMNKFFEETKSMTRSLNHSIHSLRGDILETFGVVEEAKCLDHRIKDKRFVNLLRTRNLDLLSVKKMRDIRSRFYYLEEQLRNIHAIYDKQWETFEAMERRRFNKEVPLVKGANAAENIQSIELIYQTILNNHNAMLNLEEQIETLASRLSDLDGLGRIRSSQPKHDTIWSVQKKPGFIVSNQSPLERTNKRNKPLPKYLRDELREFLEKRPVTVIRPPSPAENVFSRLILPVASPLEVEHSDEDGASVVQSQSLKSDIKDVSLLNDVEVSENKQSKSPLNISTASTFKLLKTEEPVSISAVPAMSTPNIFSIAAANSDKNTAPLEISFSGFKLQHASSFTTKSPNLTTNVTAASSASSISFSKTKFSFSSQSLMGMSSMTPVASSPRFSSIEVNSGVNIPSTVTPFSSKSEVFSSFARSSVASTSSFMPPASLSVNQFSFISPSQTSAFSKSPLDSSSAAIKDFKTKGNRDEVIHPGVPQETIPIVEEPDDDDDYEDVEDEDEEEGDDDEGEEEEDEEEEQEEITSTAEDKSARKEIEDASKLHVRQENTSEASVPVSEPQHLMSPAAIPQMVTQLTSSISPTEVAKPSPVLASLLSANKLTSPATGSSGIFTSSSAIGTCASPEVIPTSYQNPPSVLTQSASSGFTALFGATSSAVTSTASVSAPVTSPVQFQFASPVSSALTTSNTASSVSAFSFTLPTTLTTTTTANSTPSVVFGQSSTSTVASTNTVPAFSIPAENAAVFSVPTTSTPMASNIFGTSTFSFGQNTTVNTSTSATTGIFGKPSFGSQPTTASSTASTFSLGQSDLSAFSPNQNAAKSGFGSAGALFGQTQTMTGSSFGQLAGQSNTAAGNLFGQSGNELSFFGGLGGKPNPVNASKNVFGGALSFTATPHNTSMFGVPSATSTEGNSLWSKPVGSPGSFSSGTASGGVGMTGFGGFQQSPTKPVGFGGSPSFGSGPSFGGSPSFGNIPSGVFGSHSQPQPSAPGFGSFAAAASNAPSFGALASMNSPTFGSVTPQSKPAEQTFSPPFGSSPMFGAATGSPNTGFGSQGASSFSQWRS